MPDQGVVFIVAGAGDPAGERVVAVCDVDGEEVIGWEGRVCLAGSSCIWLDNDGEVVWGVLTRGVRCPGGDSI